MSNSSTGTGIATWVLMDLKAHAIEFLKSLDSNLAFPSRPTMLHCQDEFRRLEDRLALARQEVFGYPLHQRWRRRSRSRTRSRTRSRSFSSSSKSNSSSSRDKDRRQYAERSRSRSRTRSPSRSRPRPRPRPQRKWLPNSTLRLAPFASFPAISDRAHVSCWLRDFSEWNRDIRESFPHDASHYRLRRANRNVFQNPTNVNPEFPLLPFASKNGELCGAFYAHDEHDPTVANVLLPHGKHIRDHMIMVRVKRNPATRRFGVVMTYKSKRKATSYFSHDRLYTSSDHLVAESWSDVTKLLQDPTQWTSIRGS